MEINTILSTFRFPRVLTYFLPLFASCIYSKTAWETLEQPIKTEFFIVEISQRTLNNQSMIN